jgi:hypothetical protein
VLTVVGSIQMSTLSSQFQRQAEQNRHLRNRALGTEDTDLGTSPCSTTWSTSRVMEEPGALTMAAVSLPWALA